MSLLQRCLNRKPPASTDELTHIVSQRSENLSLCGLDVTAHKWVEASENDCIVCLDLRKNV